MENKLIIPLEFMGSLITCSLLLVAATDAASTFSEDCGRTQSYLGEWEMVFLLALPVLPAMPAGILWVAYRGGMRRNGYLINAAPGLFIISVVCAFGVAHVAGLWGVCDTSILSSLAAFASVGAVLSAVMLGVYRDVSRIPDKGPSPYATLLLSAMAATSFAYNVLQVADGWGPQDIEASLQSLAAIFMVGTTAAAALFGVEYGKNQRQQPMWHWACPITLFTVGALAYFVPLGADGWRVEGSSDAYLYAVQIMWLSVTIAAAMLATYAAKLPTKSPWFWIVPTMMLTVLAPSYYDISAEWACLTSMDRCTDPSPIVSMYEGAGHIGEGGTLRPWVFVTALLVIWHVFTAMAIAMLGVAMSAHIKAKRSI